MTTITTAPPADPPEQTLSGELAAIEAATGWVLWLSEQGNVWMQSPGGLELWAQTPELARHAIAVWEHTAEVLCVLATCDRPGCTHDRGSHYDGTGACGFCRCGSWVTGGAA